MGTIGQPITPSIPVVGAVGPQFATDINAILTELVNRLSTKVPLASLDVSTNLNLSGSQLLNAGFVTLANSATSPGASPVNRLTAFSGDLYYVSPSGVIQLTTGATLNAAAVGGITGAYGGGNPAQFRYDNINSRYDAYANFSTTTFADVRALGFDVAASATSAFFARILFGGAASKTYTLPVAAATTNDRPIYMDSTGQMVLGHSTKSYVYGAVGSVVTGGTFLTTAAGGIQNASVTAIGVAIPVQGILAEDRLISATFKFTKTTAVASTFIFRKAPLGGPAVTLATLSSTTIGANQQVTVALGAPEAVSAANSYWVDFASAGGTANSDIYYGFNINSDLQA